MFCHTVPASSCSNIRPTTYKIDRRTRRRIGAHTTTCRHKEQDGEVMRRVVAIGAFVTGSAEQLCSTESIYDAESHLQRQKLTPEGLPRSRSGSEISDKS